MTEIEIAVFHADLFLLLLFRPVVFSIQEASPSYPDIFWFCFQACAVKELGDEKLDKAIDVINRKLKRLYISGQPAPIMHKPSVVETKIYEARQNGARTPFLSLDQPFMEILNIKRNHWLLVSNFGQGCQKVVVYDSLRADSSHEDEVFKEVCLASFCRYLLFIRIQYCFYSNGAAHWSIHGHVIQII